MKNNPKYLLLMVLPLGIILLAACTPASNYDSFGVVPKPRIIVKANKNNTQLEIDTAGGPKCKKYSGKNENGCVVAEEREVAWLSFELKGQEGWEFTQMTICKGDTKSSLNCNLNVHDRREFEAYDASNIYISEPDKNGVILIPKGSEAATEFYLLDHNLKRQNYFYTLRACHPEHQCRDTDPPIINRGRY